MYKQFGLVGISILVLAGSSYGEWISGGRGWKYSNGDTIFYPWSTACKIGIGTTSPGSKLHVSSGHIVTDNTYSLRSYGIGTIGGTNTEFLDFYHNGASGAYIGADKTGTGAYRSLYIQTGGSTSMFIKNNGNVGIGTTSPGARLEVNGDICETCSGGTVAARWTSGNNHCYIRIDQADMSFYEARRACENLGGYLATITSPDEQDFVWTNVGASGRWIGFTDVRTEGTWEWITGEIAVMGQDSVYTNWNTGEPNDSGGEDGAGFTSGGKWNDWPCASTAVDGCICEKDW